MIVVQSKFRKILHEYARDSATTTADRVGISRPTVSRIYQPFRERIFILVQKESKKMYGRIESIVDVFEW